MIEEWRFVSVMKNIFSYTSTRTRMKMVCEVLMVELNVVATFVRLDVI